MLVIYRVGAWELITAPQDLASAWQLAERLTAETGINHHVARI